MDIVATIIIAILSTLGVIVPAFFVFRADIKKQKAAERAGQSARLDDVDERLWKRMREILDEKEKKEAELAKRIEAIEDELRQEREARQALATASAVDRQELVERVEALEADLKKARREVAVLRAENKQLKDQLNTKSDKVLSESEI
jgi:hypothetical protein